MVNYLKFTFLCFLVTKLISLSETDEKYLEQSESWFRRKTRKKRICYKIFFSNKFPFEHNDCNCFDCKSPRKNKIPVESLGRKNRTRSSKVKKSKEKKSKEDNKNKLTNRETNNESKKKSVSSEVFGKREMSTQTDNQLVVLQSDIESILAKFTSLLPFPSGFSSFPSMPLSVCSNPSGLLTPMSSQVSSQEESFFEPPFDSFPVFPPFLPGSERINSSLSQEE